MSQNIIDIDMSGQNTKITICDNIIWISSDYISRSIKTSDNTIIIKISDIGMIDFCNCLQLIRRVSQKDFDNVIDHCQFDQSMITITQSINMKLNYSNCTNRINKLMRLYNNICLSVLLEGNAYTGKLNVYNRIKDKFVGIDSISLSSQEYRIMDKLIKDNNIDRTSIFPVCIQDNKLSVVTT